MLTKIKQIKNYTSELGLSLSLSKSDIVNTDKSMGDFVSLNFLGLSG